MPKSAKEAAVMFGAYIHFERLSKAYEKLKKLDRETLLRVIRDMPEDERLEILALCGDMTSYLSQVEAALEEKEKLIGK